MYGPRGNTKGNPIKRHPYRRIAVINRGLPATILVTSLAIAGNPGFAQADSTGASEAAIAQCNQATNVYNLAEGTLQDCGYTIYPLVGTQSLSDGGTSYTYDVNGLTVVQYAPPANFDAVTASEAELAQYGIPPRPSGVESAAESSWEAAWAHVLFPPPTSFLVGDPFISYAASPDIWGGWVSPNSSGWADALTSWSEPSLGSCSKDSNNYGGIWTGLGGASSSPGDLEQVGTAIRTGSPSGSPIFPNGEAWWEVITNNNNNPPVAMNFVASAGATVTGDVEQLISHTNGEFGLTVDTSTGYGYEQVENLSSWDTSTAEAIVERVPYSSNSNGLPNIGNFSFSSAQDNNGTGGGWKNIAGASGAYSLNLTNENTGDELEQTGSASGSGFSATYKTCL